MYYKSFLLSAIFLLFTNCANNNLLTNNKNTIPKKEFSNKGFALVFNKKDYDAGLIAEKIDERSLVIFQKNLKVNTQVKITNLINNKYLIASIGKESIYPIFNNSVISVRIAKELDLNIEEPYIEIVEISQNSMFVAKKAKTFDEEKNVAKKAPIKSVNINDLNKINVSNKKLIKRNFSYEIKIADFFFKDTAKLMMGRIIDETEVKKPRIKKISKEKYRVFLGPFDTINSLQKSYNDINILEFENIEIIRND
tara:strand:+ start:203 stop:961 length:759 start_codon:yes stop_codon:yes gene_type:complete